MCGNFICTLFSVHSLARSLCVSTHTNISLVGIGITCDNVLYGYAASHVWVCVRVRLLCVNGSGGMGLCVLSIWIYFQTK